MMFGVGDRERLTSGDTETERRRYDVIRLDSFKPLPGTIVEANSAEGTAVMSVCTSPADPEHAAVYETQNFSFGAYGIAIVRKYR